MPVVRSYARQVAPAPIPSVRRSAASTPAAEGVPLEQANANVGRAIAGLGGVGVDLALNAYGQQQREQQRQRDEATRQADQLAVLAADNELSTWERDRLYDPEKGALSQKGPAAFGLPEQIDGEFAQKAADLTDRLGTQTQRAMFARVKYERGQSVALTVRRHVDQEIQSYTGNELKAKIDNTVDEATRNALDPRMVRDTLTSGEATLRAFAPRLGVGPEQLKEQIGALRSTVHVGVINRLLSEQQGQAAKVYFEETKGEIAADQIDNVQNALREGTVRQAAQKAADGILAAGGTLTEQRDKAKAITDPDVRDQTLSYIEHESIVQDKADQDAKEAQSRSVYDILDKTGSVRNIPAPVWAQMGGGERSAARSYAKSLAEGTDVKTDLKAYYGLLQTAMDDPEAFSRLNLYELGRSKLSKSDFEQFAGIQLSIRNKDRTKTDEQLSGPSTFTQIWNDTVKHAGIKDDTEASYQLRRRFEQTVETEQRVRGKKLDNVEQQQILDRLLLSVPGSASSSWLKPWTWGTDDKRGMDLTLDDIPQDQRQQIVDALRRGGQPVTESTILDTYLRSLARKK